MTDPASAQCPLCMGPSAPFATGIVLGDRPVEYARCRHCCSIFLPDPDWLDEAYANAISDTDVGLLERCLQLANITHAIIGAERLDAGPFLDFAGGYGTLTRLMRDRGRPFLHHDPLCENLFARGLEGDLTSQYRMVTAFEVLEHLPDPRQQLAQVAATTDLLLISTEVLPTPAPAPGSWDYYSPESGQHITFPTVQSLESLASALGFQATSSGRLLHLFHRRPLRRATRLLLWDERLAYTVGAVASEVARRRGLTQDDSLRAIRAARGD